MDRISWVESWVKQGGKYEVLDFISGVLFCHKDESDAIYSVFASGYCYYFAVMLKVAFHRGQICHAYPYSHIVWVDDDKIAYDIGGICQDYKELIPVDFYGKALNSFRHVCTEEEISIDEQHKIVENIRATTTISKYGLRCYENR